MFYKISDDIAIRSWSLVPHAYYIKGNTYAQPLFKKEFETMLLCDGEHDLEFDETVALLLLKKMIVACKQGEHPSERLSGYGLSVFG